jgi:ribosomal protein S18 acetylase RimI-like enzyme
MTITLRTPAVDELDEAVAALREWQHEGSPMQLHSGDLGWYYRFGIAQAAAVIRTWSRDGRILAVGMLDDPTVLRMTVAPDAFRDDELARRLAEDLTLPERGVLPPGHVAVEAPVGLLLHELLTEENWGVDEPWTPLFRDLTEPVKDPGVRIEVIGPDQAGGFAKVIRSAFNSKKFTAESWHLLASGSPYADARSLGAYDDQGNLAAAITVWSAGPGKPGVIEPMGAHQDYRRRGFGTAICVAAAAALREMGSSSARVCTLSSNVGGVLTYQAAGFQAMPEIRDRIRAV